MSKYLEQVLIERAASEGDQLKAAIRELFETSREGAIYSEDNPLSRHITGVNGVAEKTVHLCKHPDKKGAIIIWYE